MKTSILLLISFFILTSSNSFSTPLNGTYTIGSGGNYTTISSAIDDAMAIGINGPTIFEIFSGDYYDTLEIDIIPGSSLINSLTLKSMSGNSEDVLIHYYIYLHTSNIVIKNLSFKGLYIDGGQNINILNNNFMGGGFEVHFPWNNSINGGFEVHSPYSDYLNLIENDSVSAVYITGDEGVGTNFEHFVIKKNVLDFMLFRRCTNILIENNIIKNSIIGFGFFGGIFSKNKITGSVYVPTAKFYNNFILGNLTQAGVFINNTIVGGDSTIPTINTKYISDFKNNVIINPAGGSAVFNDATSLNSDYNLFYNGGNSNLINYNGVSYSNVQDFYNVTGLDQHSSDQPVNFVSPTDLHLAPTSFGDPLLIGIPDTNVVDDIDGQTRSLTSPFKGADEIFDIPSPVELSAFNSTINLNNVTLYWTTTSEINNLGFAIERSVNNGEWLNVGFVQGHGTVTTASSYVYVDRNINPDKYNYRLKQIDYNGNYEYYNLSGDVLIGSPDKFKLSQNYPNPFNPSTVINYEIASNSNVQLKIYDISGKEVMTLVNELKEPGRYEATFNGSNFASGVYYYKLTAGNFTSVKKMFLVK